MSTPNNERLDALMRDLRAEAARGLTPLDRAHTPEPWDETTHSRTWRETGGVITQIYRAMIDEDYDRTRACVNACAGMDDPATEIARLREVNAALFQTVHAITLLRDSVDETDEDYLRACQCPECKQPWTVRECRVMLDKLAGGCMCGKWSFDARAAIARAEEKP